VVVRLSRCVYLLLALATVLALLVMGAAPTAPDVTAALAGVNAAAVEVQQTTTPVSFLPLIARDYAAPPTGTLSPFPFTLQDGSPTYLANFANNAGCNWQGMAGQAFNLSGQPILGLLVHLEGGGLNYDTLTGSKPEYGTGGYELFISNTPQTTTNTYRIQLRTGAGQPLSDSYVIPTFADCNKNLALVNFAQNH
jgi:hypothetical protein